MKSNKVSSSEHFYDIPALQDLIRKLKVRKEDFLYEADALEKEISGLDEKAIALRGELNVLSAVDHVRIHTHKKKGGDDDAFSEEADDNTEFDKKFVEANMKLDIKILNTEIRGSLPALEAEALKWEEAVFRASVALKAAKAQYDSLPADLTTTTAEMEAEIAKLQRKRDSIKSSYATDTANCLREVQRGLAQVRALMADARQQAVDVELMRGRERRCHEAYMEEKARVDWLLEQLLRTKVALGGEGSAGWASALFLDSAGSLDGVVPESAVPSLLSPWLTRPDAPDGCGEQLPVFVPEQAVREAVREAVVAAVGEGVGVGVGVGVGRSDFLHICAQLCSLHRK